MKKNVLMLTNLIVIALILSVSGVILYNDAMNYRMLAMRQVENNVLMTSVNVAHDIEQVTTEQRTVAKTLATSPAVHELLDHEKEDDETIEEISSYLNHYKQVYHYDVVFLVSAETGRYYYEDGLNKVVSEESEFDSWYYNFIDLNQDYDIQIDRDETNKMDVSVFVNYRVKDEEGKLLGVIGSAKSLGSLNSDLMKYQHEYDLKIYLTNIGNAHNSFTDSTTYYKPVAEIADELGISEEELKDLDNEAAVSYLEGDSEKCVVARNIPSLYWDVVIIKNTVNLRDSFLAHLKSGNMYVLIAIAGLVILSVFMMNRTKRAFARVQNTDELTQLPNRRLFEREITRLLGRKNTEQSFFILDIDNFKQFNDTLGHLYGNSVLAMVGAQLKNTAGRKAVVCRWGGDEFVGIIRASKEESKTILEQLNLNLAKEDTKIPVTCSIGITDVRKGDSLDDLTSRADRALYDAKLHGKAQCSIQDDAL